MVVNVGINGLGRIGRCILRAIYELCYNNDINIIAANSPGSTEQIAYLLQYDSVHSKFRHSIREENDQIIIDNKDIIKIYHEKEPSEIPWNDIDMVLECSGKFNNRALEHKKVSKIIVSGPSNNADNTIIYGVNHNMIKKSDKVISIGSCTTNCLAPLAYILNNDFIIEEGFFTTIHAYTSDQNILDNSHKKDFRRTRACNLSMIPTTTGAAKVIGKIIKKLKWKDTGYCYKSTGT